MKNTRLMLLSRIAHMALAKVRQIDDYTTADVAEALEESITSFVKENELETKHLKYGSIVSPEWDAETQVIIEIGYYVRRATPSAEDVCAAMSTGSMADYLRFLIIPQLAVVIKHMCHDNHDKLSVDDVFNNLAEIYNHLPTLRGIISIGEHESGIHDISLAMDDLESKRDEIMMHAIPDAKWYWVGLVEDYLDRWVAISIEANEDGIIECEMDNTDKQSYLEEWMWDMMAGRTGWIALDWERVSSWGMHVINIHDMLCWAVLADLSTKLKEIFFAPETTQWIHENR